MEHKIKKIEGSKYELSIEMTKEDLQPHYEKAYAKARKEIHIEGFRRGKVPLNMVKARYGKSIEAEAVNDIINEIFPKVIKDNDIRLVGEPALVDIKKNDKDGFFYILNIEMMPAVELKEYKGIEINEPVKVVSDEDIQNVIDGIRREHGEAEEIEEIIDNGIVSLEYSHINDGVKNEQVDEEDIDLSNPKFPAADKEIFIGKKLNEEFEAKLTIFNNDEVFVKITKVSKINLVEFTDEIAKTESEGKFDNVADYKENLTFEMQKHFDKEAHQLLENNIVEKLVEIHEDIDVPEVSVKEATKSIVKRMFANMSSGQQEIDDKLLTDELLSAYMPMGKKSVIWELVKDAIVEKEELIIEDYDYDEWMDENMADLEDAKKASTLAEMKEYNYLQPQILQKKVVDLILDFATTIEVDFNNKPLEDETGAEVIDEDIETEETSTETTDE